MGEQDNDVTVNDLRSPINGKAPKRVPGEPNSRNAADGKQYENENWRYGFKNCLRPCVCDVMRPTWP